MCPVPPYPPFAQKNFAELRGTLPVYEIDQREQRAWRTKDIWEDQKAGWPKKLIAEKAEGTKYMPEDMLASLIVE